VTFSDSWLNQKDDLLGDGSEYAHYGIGEIIRELGTELLDLKEVLEEESRQQCLKL
jgi:hypothetical protein